jgi:hypothetical protein
MELCNSGHDEICFDDERRDRSGYRVRCPACSVVDELNSYMDDVKNLKEKIAELEEAIFMLKSEK